MQEPVISALDLSAWLRKARRQEDPVAWLDALNDKASDAVAAGDEYITMTTDEAGSTSASREVNARFVQHVTELCLQRLEAEEAAGGAENLPPAGAVRYGDFSP